MIIKKKHNRILILFLLFFFSALLLASLRLERYEMSHLQPSMSFKNIGNLSDERISFHSFRATNPANKNPSANVNYAKDDEFAELLVITPKKVFLLKDGFEEPIQLKNRVSIYREQVFKYNQRKKNLKELTKLGKQKAKVSIQGGERSPEYMHLDNKITIVIRRGDEQTLAMYTKVKESKQLLREALISSGKTSLRYKNQKKIVTSLETQLEQRENAIKDILNQRSLANMGSFYSSTSSHTLNSGGTKATAKTKATEGGELAVPSSPTENENIYAVLQPPPPFVDIKHANLHRNSPDGYPDYVIISDTGEERPSFRNVDMAGKTSVKDNFSSLYKTVRNRHIQRYTNQFRELFFRPVKFGAHVKTSTNIRDPLCRIEKGSSTGTDAVADKAKEEVTSSEKETQKEKEGEIITKNTKNLLSLKVRIDIYSREGTHYTALDCDRNGITETFLVYESDGFHWNVKDMPNTISIYNNNDPEVEAMIKDLVQIEGEGDPSVLEDFKKKQTDIQKSLLEKIKGNEKISRRKY